MLQKDNRYKVLKIFFDNPNKDTAFQLREISREIKVAPTSVKKYLNDLVREELIKRSKHRIHGFPIYHANRESEYFRFLKKIDMITKIYESGLIKYLSEYMPDAIVLFGSASKGEDLKDSDVDIFLLGKEIKLDLQKFEKKIKRKINIFFNENFDKLSSELKNNILNGVILKGYLKVF